MKSQIRILGIDDVPFDKFDDDHTSLIGCLYRGGLYMDGVLSRDVTIDGDDASDKVVDMVISSKFRTQIRAVMTDGINCAGFNFFDIEKIFSMIRIPVIVIMRKRPDLKRIKSTLKKIGMQEKIRYLEKAGKIHGHEKIFFQSCGIDAEDAKEILDLSCTHSFIPEPIRIAHLIGSGIYFGESRGQA